MTEQVEKSKGCEMKNQPWVIFSDLLFYVVYFMKYDEILVEIFNFVCFRYLI